MGTLCLQQQAILVQLSCTPYQAIQVVLERGEKGHVYNVGGANEKKNIDIALEILRRLSLPEMMIELVGDRPGHDFRYSLDCEKIYGLGWKPRVPFEEGLQKTIDWYAANEWWWGPPVDRAFSFVIRLADQSQRFHEVD